MSKPFHALSSHPPVVREAAKAVAQLHSASMLSRQEMHDLVRHFKHGVEVIFSPKMRRYATGTHYSKAKGLVHRERRVVCADELETVLLSFRLNPLLPVLRTKINDKFANIPPDAIVAWHAKITEHLFQPAAGAAGGGAVVVASILNDVPEAETEALVEGAAGPSSESEGVDSQSAGVPATDSSPGPSNINDDTVLSSSLTGAGGGGDVVTSRSNDASVDEVAVNERGAELSSQADGADGQSVAVAEADGSRGPSSNDGTTVSELSPRQDSSANNDILSVDYPPSPSSSSRSEAAEAPSAPALQVNDASDSDASSSSESPLGKHALPTDDDTDVSSEVPPPQASPKRQKRSWWSRFWS